MNRSFRNIVKEGGKVICPLFLVLPIFQANAQTSHDMYLSDPEVALQYELYIDSAANFASRQKWKDAERCTLEALRINPADRSNWLLWANLGEIRSRLGDNEGAIEAYTIGLSRNPESPKMLTGRASVLLLENRNEEALEDIESVLKIDEKAEWPLMIRGFMLLGQGKLDKAKEDFTKLTEYYPDYTPGYEGLARACVAEDNWQEALKFCDMAIEKDSNPDLWYLKVSLLADHDKLSEASEALREAMKKYPRNGNLFLLRAYIHKLSFRNEEMEIDMKLAKEYGADPHLIGIIEQKKTK